AKLAHQPAPPDDVPRVLRLGVVVHHGRRLHGERGDAAAHPLAVHGEPDRGHRRALLPRVRGRPLLPDRARARRAPPPRRGDDARGPERGRGAHAVHRVAAPVQPVLHAHARALELARLQPHHRPGARVPAGTRVRDDRLDRRGALRLVRPQPLRRRARGGHRAAAVHHGGGEPPAGPLQLHAPAHAAAGARAARHRARHRRARRAADPRQPLVLRVRALLVPPVHPARGVLQLHAALPGRGGRAADRRHADARADVGVRLHAAHAAHVPPARRQVDAPARDGGVGAALRAVRARRARRGGVDGGGGDRTPRHLLRLLLRHRADLRRQEVDARDPRAGAGLPGAHHVRRRDADRRAGGRRGVQQLPAQRRGDADPRAVAAVLVAPGGLRARRARAVRAPLPRPRRRGGRRGRVARARGSRRRRRAAAV
ncbi:MAG: ProP protein, partial [uncultured Gemmatimonadaceae bacterium]